MDGRQNLIAIITLPQPSPLVRPKSTGRPRLRAQRNAAAGRQSDAM